MRILLVEDEHKIASSIKKGLEQEHYAVDVAYTGIAGYDLASSEDYDLIILDLMLPDMNGIDICVKLREQNVHTPILILTAKGQLHDKVEGLDSGADDYLTKPFSFEELLARIRALTRRPHDTFNSTISVGNLTLDFKTYVVKRDEKVINLSSKEFSLLEYLMRNAGRILRKEEIINHVWDYNSDVLPNTVEVYVKILRKKIGNSLIYTIRGFGYKMEKNHNV